MLGHYFLIIILAVACSAANGIIFDGVKSLHVWITVSSLINKDANNHKSSLIFRQIELNWINAPLDHDDDYIGLYLDNEPSARSMPVSVHRLAGQTNGHIITDYFLPQLDFYNETSHLLEHNQDSFNSNEASRNSETNDGNSLATNSRRNDDRDQLTKFTRARMLDSHCVGYCLAYHSRNKILASNCLRTNPTWMQDSFQYINSRSLPILMIPGSHNSATYPKALDKSALNMINKYQMNQDEPIFNQLVYGIRHLDLRVGYNKVKQRPERYWIYHDIFRTDVSVEEVLDQVGHFLDLTSHEVIIMDFHRFTVGFQSENQSIQRERHAKLIELIFKRLGPYIVPSYLGQHAPLQELVSAGRRLIIGYAARSMILGSNELSILGLLSASDKLINKGAAKQVQDIDAIRQDQEDSSHDLAATNDNKITKSTSISGEQQPVAADRPAGGSSLFNKLRSIKSSIGRRFTKRSPADSSASARRADNFEVSLLNRNGNGHELDSHNLAKVALFFPQVRHLWPDKDSLEGLAQYMNDTTCRKYFGELRSMMAELTPTVFGAISDKYDGNRRLAQQVNRPVTDWIRDRWLHCVNIVASDYFLGNNLIELSIYANKMRAHQGRNVHTFSDSGKCHSLKKIGHLLDKSKIPIQFTTFRRPAVSLHDDGGNYNNNNDGSNDMNDMPFSPASSDFSKRDNDIIAHTSPDGNRIFLKPVATANKHQSTGRERRDSFVDNFSNGFSNLFSSFKRLLNL